MPKGAQTPGEAQAGIDYTLEEVDWPTAFWQLYSVIYSLGIKLRTCKHYSHTIDEHVNINPTL